MMIQVLTDYGELKFLIMMSASATVHSVTDGRTEQTTV